MSSVPQNKNIPSTLDLVCHSHFLPFPLFSILLPNCRTSLLNNNKANTLMARIAMFRHQKPVAYPRQLKRAESASNVRYTKVNWPSLKIDAVIWKGELLHYRFKCIIISPFCIFHLERRKYRQLTYLYYSTKKRKALLTFSSLAISFLT